MKPINYISQENLFLKLVNDKILTTNERMLWLGIFWSANKLAQRTGDFNLWPDGFFTIKNDQLSALTGLSERAIRKCRDVLKELKLIDFIPGDGKKANPKYKIFYLKMIGYEIVPDGAPDYVPDSVPENGSNTVSDHVGNSPPTGSKNDADAVCDNPAESFIYNDSSDSPNTAFCTNGETATAAATPPDALKEDSGLQGIFGNAEFADMNTAINVKPFTDM